jgi:hypothetical protein
VGGFIIPIFVTETKEFVTQIAGIYGRKEFSLHRLIIE